MKNIVNLSQYKKCQKLKTSEAISCQNFSFEKFPSSLKNKKLSPGEIIFVQDQLDKIVYYIDQEGYKSKPSEFVREDLEAQKDLYLSSFLKSQNILPFK